jgi:hypothetical protein
MDVSVGLTNVPFYILCNKTLKNEKTNFNLLIIPKLQIQL